MKVKGGSDPLTSASISAADLLLPLFLLLLLQDGDTGERSRW